MIRKIATWLWVLVVTGLRLGAVDYQREVRPLLADACFRCHGFDAGARKAGLRLDQRTSATQPAKSGAIPIVPGKPEKSEVLRRLFSVDADEQMPPPETHRVLTAAEKETLRRWIAEGADYPGHWAFQPVQRPAVPAVGQPGWVRSAIDPFILAGLEAHGWQPAKEAPPATLLRRVSLDLTGLPPTPAELDAFLADPSPTAYERVVDRLLASPRYGERMSQDWLDAARFADSNGYQVDRDRELWGWRDWVVRAFNRNLPFDTFTVEQLAGDLLPNATLEQKIATGFHRNHMINEEGGIIPEEFLAEYCADRVETTATVWLGLTMNCARCHDHKYDPLTQRDYYRLLSFFHNIPESGVGDYGANIRRSTPPFLKLPSAETDAALARVKADLATTTEKWNQLRQRLEVGQPDWETRAKTAAPNWQPLAGAVVTAGETVTPLGAEGVWSGGPDAASTATPLRLQAAFPRTAPTAIQLEWTPRSPTSVRSNSVVAVAEIRLWSVEIQNTTRRTNHWTLRPANLNGTAATTELNPAVDGKAETFWRIQPTNAATGTGVFLVQNPATNIAPAELHLTVELRAAETLGAWGFRLRTTELDPALLIPPEIAPLLAQPIGPRSAEAAQRVTEFQRSRTAEHETLRERIAGLTRQADELDLASPITLVMSEMATPRTTHVLTRGSYQQPGEVVTADTPTNLLAFAAEWPRNRLGLARWLVDPRNPLTARVTVNRLWQSVFGLGLVRTAEDFGMQGEPPTHPELLDWLASEFIRTGWDIKAMMKLLVRSATYRQDSRFHPEQAAADPENRWLARGPRHRLTIEAIRDQALAVSGLLVESPGGPSVRPYHPPGLYEQVVAGSSASTYVIGTGTDLYRRTLYTYWKRSVPNPALLLFDMPFRETCTVRRARTSTPLQALNLLNDPTYVEAARALATRMMQAGGTDLESRIRHGFRLTLSREPRPAELAVLAAGWHRAAAAFRQDRTGADGLITVGASRPPAALDPVELAAFTTVASTMLNLDETITQQ